jgi:hypothetical protein
MFLIVASLRLRRRCEFQSFVDNPAIFGIWYARNKVVKTLHDQKVPKTLAT